MDGCRTCRHRVSLSPLLPAWCLSVCLSPLSAVQEWRLPEPGFLEGVKSKDKAILKMHNMSFQYPGAPKPQITNVSLQVSLSSRVACIGANGAGKSTLIKVGMRS